MLRVKSDVRQVGADQKVTSDWSLCGIGSLVDHQPSKLAKHLLGSIPASRSIKFYAKQNCGMILFSLGSLAQLVERFLYTEDVGGSSPSGSTRISAGGEIGRRTRFRS